MMRLFEVAWKRLWLIAVVAIVLVSAAVGASLLQTPQYQASVQVLVGQGGLTETPNEAVGLQQLTQTMAQIASSRPVSEAVIEELDLSTDAEEFASNRAVSQVSATQVIEISYTDTDPQRAQEVANAIGEAFSEEVSDITSSDTPITARILSQAEVPDSPASPEPVRNGILALALGGMLGVGLALLLEYFDDSWGSPEEAERISGVPTFGIIPEFTAATGKMVAPGWRKRAPDPQPVAAGVGRSVEKIEYREIARDGRVLWPMGMALVDAQGRVEETNPAFREMFGFAEKEIRGADFSEFATHPDDVDVGAKAQSELASKEREHYRIEKRCIKQDGQLMWVRLTVSAVRGPKGEARFFIAMVENITDRKQVEESLRLSKESQRHSEERLRAVVEQAPLIVHSFTPEGFSLMSNGDWDKFWHEGEEANGSNLFDDERLRSAGLTPYIEKSVKDKDVVTTPTLDCTQPQKNGSPSPQCLVNAFIHPVRDEAGRVSEVVVMLEDVTASEQAKERLRTSSAERERFEHELERAREERQRLEDELQRTVAGREQVQERLQKSEERLRSFIRFAADMSSEEEKEG